MKSDCQSKWLLQATRLDFPQLSTGDGSDIKHRMKQKQKKPFAGESQTKSAAESHGQDQYEKAMDDQRCLFYVHGGQLARALKRIRL